MLSQNRVFPLLPALFFAVVSAVVDPEVAEGLGLYQSLKYDRAVVVLGRALAKAELGEDDRKQALETLGFAYTVLGDSVNAELTFHTLLDRAPGHVLDSSLSPRLRDAFAAAKKSWSAGRKIEFRIRSELSKRELFGELVGGDPKRVGRVVAREESGKTSPLYCNARECRGERPDEDFFVDVFDHAGTTLHQTGPHHPELSAELPPWWIWAAIGAGVVGGGIALSFALSGGDDAPPGSLGKLQLP